MVPKKRHIDGTGYPLGLSGDQVPLGARILAIAGSFDAMTSDRSCRRACSVEVARAEIIRSAGTQCDPRIVDTFLGLSVEELTRLAGRQLQAGDSRPALVVVPAGATP